jgi:hypothetical protein
MGSSHSSPSVACNGHASLCNRSYSNITQIGAHDSAFVGILPTDNQLRSVTSQLNSGIRFLQAQTHNDSDILHLCHTSCLERDAGPLTSRNNLPLQNLPNTPKYP